MEDGGSDFGDRQHQQASKGKAKIKKELGNQQKQRIRFHYNNQMKITKTCLFTLLVLAQLSLALHVHATHDIEHEFCWKDSYGRGLGTVPGDCGTKEKLGLLCYEPCPKNYSRVGFDCQQNCPPDFRNDGLYCRKAEYGRGAGYTWQFLDFSDDGMLKRCEANSGKGNCEKYFGMVYPKCRPGYNPIGCCICRPPLPDCKGLGLNGGVDLSCAKKLVIGKTSLAGCHVGKESDAGLCYPICKTGYSGVGPVCWGSTPKGWVGCGMGAAVDSKTCRDAIIGEVTSVGQLAISIATMGSSTAAAAASNAAKGASKIATLTKKLSELKAAVLANKKIIKVTEQAKKYKSLKEKGEKIKQGYEKAADCANAVANLQNLKDEEVNDADTVRVSAQIAALADPTGVASIIEACSQPLCSQIFKK